MNRLMRLAPAVTALVVMFPVALGAQDTTGVGALLQAVPDTALRSAWRAAAEDGRLNTSDVRFFFPARPVLGPLKGVLVTQHALQPQSVSIAPRSIADVRWSLSRPITEYDGAFNVNAASAGSIVGGIKNDSIRLGIVYRLPGTPQPPGIQPNLALRVQFYDRTSNLTRHTRLWLTNGGETLLFQLRDGNRRPYQFDPGPRDPPLRIRQQPGLGNGRPPTLDLTYRNQHLAPAEVGTPIDVPGAGVRIFILSNVYTPPGDRPPAEGDAFAVHLLLWRTRQ